MKYVPALDGLRCYAVAMVLALHGTHGQFPGGWVGVDLFFVLSGYLITGLLASEMSATGRVRLGRFYARRALRLIPALVAAVSLAGLLWRVTPGDEGSWPRAAACVLAYAANLAPAPWLGSLSHCWSLAVEEHYYLAWPPTFLLAWKAGGRRGAAVAASAAIAAVVATRPASVATLDAHGLSVYRFTLARADSLLIGSLAALVVPPSVRIGPRPAGVLLAAGLAIGSGAGFLLGSESAGLARGGFTTIAVVAAVVVVAAARPSPVAGWLSAAPLVWAGRRSYGAYLYHFPVFLACESLRVPHSPWNAAWVSALRIGLTLAVVAASYRWVESPFLALKSRVGRPTGQTSFAPALSDRVLT